MLQSLTNSAAAVNNKCGYEWTRYKTCCNYDNLAKYIEARKDAHRAMIFNHLDVELEEAIDAAPAGTFVAIFTHSHDLDYRLVRAALRRDDLAYVGLIGSRTKRARFEDRLKDDGISAAQIARLSCPIGIPTLKGKAPAVIAVAVAAELLQLAGDAPE